METKALLQALHLAERLKDATRHCFPIISPASSRRGLDSRLASIWGNSLRIIILIDIHQHEWQR